MRRSNWLITNCSPAEPVRLGADIMEIFPLGRRLSQWPSRRWRAGKPCGLGQTVEEIRPRPLTKRSVGRVDEGDSHATRELVGKVAALLEIRIGMLRPW